MRAKINSIKAVIFDMGSVILKVDHMIAYVNIPFDSCNSIFNDVFTANNGMS